MATDYPLAGASEPRVRSASPPLRLVFWETTTGCNLACAHCRRLEVSQGLTKSELTTDEARRLMDQIAEAGRPVLVFSGGEPLMRPDLFELAAHAKEKGLLTALASNGTMIDAGVAGQIAGAGFDRVSISLDGADAGTHDGLRRQAGAFDKALAALGHLRRAGVATQINCTIAKHNKDQLEAVLKLGEQTGAAAVHYFLLVPVGCGEEIADDQMLNGEEVEARLRLLADLQEKTSLQIKPTCVPHYYRVIRQRMAQPHEARAHTPHGHGADALHRVTKGCLAGTAVCFVSHDGKVFPCGYLPLVAGDVRVQDFGEIWRRSALFAELRDPTKLKGKCGRCQFRTVCGGCRARAFYQFGDCLAEEPLCTFEPARPQEL